ncbi:MAG TPA: nucleotidyltransferase family protein [Xanthomonadales bacterium]|nr:nucleotidyltransferase family protein [Xanthomonadales bacterium]
MYPDAAAPAASLGAILLAAGSSSRLGQPKQLVSIEGEPLVVRQAKMLAALGFARVVVVTGAEHSQIAKLLADVRVQCVRNPDWEEGMGRSLACGVNAMPERARAALVLLCDQWKVMSDDVDLLISAWVENPQAGVVSTFDVSSGPPAILPRAMFQRLSRLKGDMGARNILKHWKGEIIPVQISNAGADLDLPEDLEKMGPGSS